MHYVACSSLKSNASTCAIERFRAHQHSFRLIYFTRFLESLVMQGIICDDDNNNDKSNATDVPARRMRNIKKSQVAFFERFYCRFNTFLKVGAGLFFHVHVLVSHSSVVVPTAFALVCPFVLFFSCFSPRSFSSFSVGREKAPCDRSLACASIAG